MLTAGDVLPEETAIAFPDEPVAIETETPAVVLSAFPRVLLTTIPSPRLFCVTVTAAALTDEVFVGLDVTARPEPNVEVVTATPFAVELAPELVTPTLTAVPAKPGWFTWSVV